jgi:hypothetical protein
VWRQYLGILNEWEVSCIPIPHLRYHLVHVWRLRSKESFRRWKVKNPKVHQRAGLLARGYECTSTQKKLLLLQHRRWSRRSILP